MPPIPMPTPAPPREWFRVSDLHTPTNASEPSSVDVYIYDVIGEDWWTGEGMTSNRFRTAIESVTADEIHLYVNSPGGDVFEGIAIQSILSRHPSKVIATVDSLAASAASFIIMAADEIVMTPYAEIMIHDVSTIVQGQAKDIQAAADRIDGLSNQIAQMYADRAGGTVEDWRALMLAETWMTADEAITAGLADRKTVEAPTAGAKNVFDLGRMFAHAGRAAAPEPLTVTALAAVRTRAQQDPTQTPESIEQRIRSVMLDRRRTTLPAAPEDTTHNLNEGPDMAFSNEVRNRLGITDETLDEAGILAALDEVLAEQPVARTNPTGALPADVVAVDAATLATLREQAAAGAAAREEQQSNRREALASAAVEDGRIAPARREAWIARLAADPAEEETLAGLAPGLTVNTTRLGHSGGLHGSGDTEGDLLGDEALYNTFYPSTETTKES